MVFVARAARSCSNLCWNDDINDQSESSMARALPGFQPHSYVASHEPLPCISADASRRALLLNPRCQTFEQAFSNLPLALNCCKTRSAWRQLTAASAHQAEQLNIRCCQRLHLQPPSAEELVPGVATSSTHSHLHTYELIKSMTEAQDVESRLNQRGQHA